MSPARRRLWVFVVVEVAAVLVGLIVFLSGVAIGYFSCGGKVGQEDGTTSEELDEGCAQRWYVGGGVLGVVIAVVPAGIYLARGVNRADD